MMKQATPPAVLYTRWSPRPSAKDCLSTALQLAKLRAYCTAHGYAIATRTDRGNPEPAEFSDEDLSGEDAANRPELRKAIDLAKSKRAILVCYKLDRFARRTRDTLDLVEELTAAKADLACVVETINTRGPQGKFFLTILAAFAELERETIAQRTSDGLRGRQAMGLRVGRPDRCPFGMMPDENGPRLIRRAKDDSVISDLPARLVECPAEQATLVRIRELRAQGHGALIIAALLDREGRPCRGKRWHRTTVQKLLNRMGLNERLKAHR
jgi:DNA invertase Pin-like site-specific DNA recombinase